jgi:hypothetical protein
VRAGAVVIATGVQYLRPPIDGLAELEGADVYYAATENEARHCKNAPTVVIGGGNSAGQAAMFLGRSAGQVHLVVRGPSLAAFMSNYLSSRLETHLAISMEYNAEVVALHGTDKSHSLAIRNSRDGVVRDVTACAVFVMIGAKPNAALLLDMVEAQTTPKLTRFRGTASQRSRLVPYSRRRFHQERTVQLVLIYLPAAARVEYRQRSSCDQQPSALFAMDKTRARSRTFESLGTGSRDRPTELPLRAPYLPGLPFCDRTGSTERRTVMATALMIAEAAGSGAGRGGAANLPTGLGVLAIPGLGPVVAAGWLASTAVSAAPGAAGRHRGRRDGSWYLHGGRATLCGRRP